MMKHERCFSTRCVHGNVPANDGEGLARCANCRELFKEDAIDRLKEQLAQANATIENLKGSIKTHETQAVRLHQDVCEKSEQLAEANARAERFKTALSALLIRCKAPMSGDRDSRIRWFNNLELAVAKAEVALGDGEAG